MTALKLNPRSHEFREATQRNFLNLMAAHGIPSPRCEFAFNPERAFRFDYAWPQQLVAVEQEGGIHTSGHHTRPTGYLRDLEKYNLAAVGGWCLLRFTPTYIRRGDCVPWIRKALGMPAR